MSIHTGVDIPAGNKAPVLAAADGVVVWTGMGLMGHFPDKNDPYGNAISIRHDFGYLGQPVWSIYAHLSEIKCGRGSTRAFGRPNRFGGRHRQGDRPPFAF